MLAFPGKAFIHGSCPQPCVCVVVFREAVARLYCLCLSSKKVKKKGSIRSKVSFNFTWLDPSRAQCDNWDKVTAAKSGDVTNLMKHMKVHEIKLGGKKSSTPTGRTLEQFSSWYVSPCATEAPSQGSFAHRRRTPQKRVRTTAAL